MQVEQEGLSVKGSPHFNPDPDAETLYKAMKGIGEWVSVALPQECHDFWGLCLLCSRPLCSQPCGGDARDSPGAGSSQNPPRLTSSTQKITKVLPSPALVYTHLQGRRGEEGDCTSLSNGIGGGRSICCMCLPVLVQATSPHSV